MEIEPLRASPPHSIELLDQTLLPFEERYLTIQDVPALCEAIRSLRVRGAPLLGVAGAAGVAIAAATSDASDAALAAAAEQLIATRPTAVDLAVRTREAVAVILAAGPHPGDRRAAAWKFLAGLMEARVREDQVLGNFGAELIQPGTAVLTHCNTGALATGGRGTALAVIRTAWERGNLRECFATETRPLLQGARLTIWELQRIGIPATLLPDTAAASLIASDCVHAVITGADRIAANGDTANKVGTYGLAAVATRHDVPFYIAAPMSTVDLDCPNGGSIPIEMRFESEVGGFGAQRWAPKGTPAYNPAFDVTPGQLIAAIVTERGIARPPFLQTLRTLAES